jgi:hypothetical protein
MMKNLRIIFKSLIIASFIGLAGCYFDGSDNEAPAVPRGLHSITGDGEVMLTWYENTEPDLAGYRIYQNLTPTGYYYLIGETNLDYFLDYGLTNGQTYYYAISAFDFNDNESDLSYEIAYDTPRPEGYNEQIFDYVEEPNYAGWNFSAYAVVPYNASSCDFYYGYDDMDEAHYLYIGRPGGLIQDFGYTQSLDEITYAPDDGWSSIGIVEAIVGHTYIIWTWDNHFAKIRLTSINTDYVIFDWAYQVDPGNPELIITKNNDKKGG